ncbi:hypothetical protein D3C86_1884230 [compost metagenome]
MAMLKDLNLLCRLFFISGEKRERGNLGVVPGSMIVVPVRFFMPVLTGFQPVIVVSVPALIAFEILIRKCFRVV